MSRRKRSASRSRVQLVEKPAQQTVKLSQNGLAGAGMGAFQQSSSAVTMNWPNSAESDSKLYPAMPKIPEPGSADEPTYKSYGATGVTIFAGVIDQTTTGEYNTDFGWQRGVQIYDTMLRNDGQVAAVKRIIEMPILRAKWTIKPGSQEARDKEIAAFVESCLFHDMSYTTAAGLTVRQPWIYTLKHILNHLWYGFMPFETCYKKEDGWIKWARWTPLLPRTLYRWWVDAGNDLVGIQIYTWKDNQKLFIDIPANKLLLFINDQEGNNFEGISLLRAAYKHWYYLDRFYAIDAVAIERAAVAPPVVKLSPNPTAEEIAAAKNIVQNVRVNEQMGITLTNGMELDVLKSGQGMPTLPSIEHHDMKIARSVLAQFLNLGSHEAGSYALAQSQMTMFLAAYQAVCEYIADTINTEIRRLVDWNFDDVETYPLLQCSKLVAQDITTLVDAWNKLNASRSAPLLQPDPAIQSYYLESLGLPNVVSDPQFSNNPTSDANDARPEAAGRDDDHGDAQAQGPGGQVVQSQNSGNRGKSGPNPGSSGANPGSSGANPGKSELNEELDKVQLLVEALDAVGKGLLSRESTERKDGADA